MNIVEALGGPEGAEVIIEQAWEESASGYFQNNPIFRHQINSEPASEEYPLTDIRIPNYYRNRQLEVHPILEGMAKARGGSWAGVYHYHWAGNRLDLIRDHDALLLKIVQHTFAKLANNPKVEWKHRFTGQYFIPPKRSYSVGMPEPDMTLVGQVKWYFDKAFSPGTWVRGRFLGCLTDWISQPATRVRLELLCRRELEGKDRQLWLAAMRLLKPFTANQRARLAIPPAKDAPTTQSCFELLKYFSNNYDVPFDLALQYALRQLALNRQSTDLQEAIRLKNANIATMMEEANFAAHIFQA